MRAGALAGVGDGSASREGLRHVTAIILATIGTRAPGAADSATIVWTLVLLAVGTTIVGQGRRGWPFRCRPSSRAISRLASRSANVCRLS